MTRLATARGKIFAKNATGAPELLLTSTNDTDVDLVRLPVHLAGVEMPILIRESLRQRLRERPHLAGSPAPGE